MSVEQYGSIQYKILDSYAGLKKLIWNISSFN